MGYGVVDRDRLRWLPALGLVVILHLMVWWGYNHFKDEITPPKPLSAVQISLLAPPPEPRIAPPLPQPKAEPNVIRKPVAAPTATQVEKPLADQAVQQIAQAPATVAQPVPQTPAPVQPAPEPPLELPRYNAAYLSNPPPAYPLSARRRGIEGTVLVRAEVAAGGECQRVELKKSSGADALDQAALEAVKKWRFVPAKRGSQAVVAWVEVPITFKLENN